MCFLQQTAFWGEAAKLTAQLGGALLISWLTVQWALGRYKAEKLWERETGALTELLGAIAEIRAVVGKWLDDEMMHRDRPTEWDEEQRQRYNSAKRRVEGIAVIAAVLLPDSLQSTVDDLLKALDGRYESWVDDLLACDAALVTASKELVVFGRLRLRTRG